MELELTSAQMIRLVKAASSLAEDKSRRVSRKSLLSEAARHPSDDARLMVLLENRGIPASVRAHLSAAWGELFKNRDSVSFAQLSREFSKVREQWSTEGFAVLEAYQQKLHRAMLSKVPSIAMVDWLGDASPDKYLETAPVFESWPRRILSDPRWNLIESPAPEFADLPLASTWVPLRLNRVTGLGVGLRAGFVPAEAFQSVEPNVPAYLNSDYDESYVGGDPFEDVICRAKGLIAILGLPGAGKSTLVRKLARILITDAKFPFILPLYVPLREFAVAKAADPALTLLEFFLRQCGVTTPAQLRRWSSLYDAAVQERRAGSSNELFFWLLDGWDEIPAEMRSRVLTDLRAVSHVPGIVTSRHSAVPFSLPCEEFHEIAPLNRHDQRELVTSWLTAVNYDNAADRVWNRIDRSADFRKLARSPMLLTLLCACLVGDSRTSRIRTRSDVYRHTMLRIARHHSKRYPSHPFDDDRMQLTERLAQWLLLDAPEAPRYVFTPTDADTATGDPSLFRYVLQPSRIVCSPTPYSETYQFLHATFQEFLTARWFARNPVQFRSRVGRNVIYSRGWNEVARFAAAVPAASELGRSLWDAARSALSEPDNFGVLLARTAGLVSDAGAADGGKKLVGRDLRADLWKLIWRHRQDRPLLLVDALLELDTKWFIDAVRKLDPHSASRLRKFPILNQLDEDIVAECLQQPRKRKTKAEQLRHRAEDAVAKHDFLQLQAIYRALPSDDENWDLREELLKLAAQFGEAANDFLLNEITSDDSNDIVRGIAAEVLRECGPRAVMTLVDQLATVGLEDPVAWAVLGAMDGHLLSDAEIDLVCNYLMYSSDEQIRSSAAAALATCRTRGTAHRLYTAYEREESAEVRRDILGVLVELGDAQILDQLWKLTQKLLRGNVSEQKLEAQAALQALIATAIRSRTHPRQREYLRRITGKVSGWLRVPGHALAETGMQCAVALGEELSSQVVDVLRQCQHEPPVLVEACRTVARLGIQDAIPILRSILAERPDIDCDDAADSLHNASAAALAELSPASLLGLTVPAAQRACAKLAFERQVLFYDDRVESADAGNVPRKHLQVSDMKQRCDVGVYIALPEEFDVFKRVFGDIQGSWSHPDLALTFHFFTAETLSGDDARIVLGWSGEMGTLRADEVSGALIREFRPSSLVVIGIAGAVGGDARLGDVLLPKEVVDYLAVGAIVDGRNSWQFESSGNNFRSSQELLNSFRNLKHESAELFGQWERDASARLKNCLEPDIHDDFVRKEFLRPTPLLLADDSKLASGPAVGKSTEFARWLVNRDRKFAAMEMESAGVYSGVDLTRLRKQPKTLAIRGISDFADERKSKVEKSTKGAIRSYCMANAASILKLAIERGAFGS